MTDEKLEKILQHALTPPVDDADIRTDHREGEAR